MSSLKHLIERNKAWAAGLRARNPGFFTELAEQQKPRYLWIGCADSRVPANEITGLAPGELFVHRNVANVVVHTDLNCLSVLQFAVEALAVEHVIVVGRHAALLEGIPDESARIDRLCELNVIEQVVHVARTTIVQDAWRRGQPLTLHAWIYGLHDGLVRDLGLEADSPQALAELYPQMIAGPGR